jgi:peptidyl-prolyl cis-trans isomerase C
MEQTADNFSCKVSATRGLIYLLLSIFILILLSQQALADANSVLAEIGEEKVTLKDLELQVSEIKRNYPEGLSREAKAALLLETVSLKVFAKEALAQGIGNEEAIEARLKDMVESFLATEYLKREVEAKIAVNEQEMLKYYLEHRQEYMEPEKIKARQIFIRTRSKGGRDNARKKVEELQKKLRGGKDFSALAREFSDDCATKNLGGDLGYLTRPRLVPELEDPVFSLKIGEISPILQSRSGFHIFRVEDRKPERFLEFEEVRERITEKLRAEKRKKRFQTLEENLYMKYRVKIYSERIP